MSILAKKYKDNPTKYEPKCEFFLNAHLLSLHPSNKSTFFSNWCKYPGFSFLFLFLFFKKQLIFFLKIEQEKPKQKRKTRTAPPPPNCKCKYRPHLNKSKEDHQIPKIVPKNCKMPLILRILPCKYCKQLINNLLISKFKWATIIPSFTNYKIIAKTTA